MSKLILTAIAAALICSSSAQAQVAFIGQHARPLHVAQMRSPICQAAATETRRVTDSLPDWLQGPIRIRLGAHTGYGVNAYTLQYAGWRDPIYISRANTAALAGLSDNTTRENAGVDLIHEIVHSRQRLSLPTWRSEGEAELLAGFLHDLQGEIPTAQMPRPYAGWVEILRQIEGDQAIPIAIGHFGPRATPSRTPR